MLLAAGVTSESGFESIISIIIVVDLDRISISPAAAMTVSDTH